MKMKKLGLSIVTTFMLTTHSYAIGDAAVIVPAIETTTASVTSLTSALVANMGLSMSTEGFGANASLLTGNVASVTSKWVPEPFQDNVNNVVGACLQDLKGSLFKGIKWPSVEICGNDIIADLKADIDTYLNKMKLKYDWQILGPRSGLIALERKEPTAFIRQAKKNNLNNVTQANKEPSKTGMDNSIKNINNSSDALNAGEKNKINYDIIVYNQTLENIKTIAKGEETLGVKFNAAIEASASNQMVENTHIDFHIQDTRRLNQQQINLYQNILEYKRQKSLGADKNVIDENKITNVSLFENMIAFEPKTFKVEIPGTKETDGKGGTTSKKMTVDLIAQNVRSLATYLDDQAAGKDLSSSSLEFSDKFLKEYFAHSEEKFNPSDINNFNYLVQAIKLLGDTLSDVKELTKNNSENGQAQLTNRWLEGLLHMQLLQIAQDFQATRSTLNVSHNNANLQIALMKNMTDKLRLLNYTNANINTMLKK